MKNDCKSIDGVKDDPCQEYITIFHGTTATTIRIDQLDQFKEKNKRDLLFKNTKCLERK